jgi:hypothetical protein
MGQFPDSPHMDHNPIVSSNNNNELKAYKNILNDFEILLEKKDECIDWREDNKKSDKCHLAKAFPSATLYCYRNLRCKSTMDTVKSQLIKNKLQHQQRD